LYRPSGYEHTIETHWELLAKIASSIRAGQYTSNIKAGKVVLVGHSLGSVLSHAVVTKYPDAADAAVLTGYAFDSDEFVTSIQTHWLLTIFAARIYDLGRYAKATGYLGFGDVYAHVQGFFKAPLDIPTVKYAQSIYQPTAVGTLVGGAGATGPPVFAEAFDKPVFLTTGQYDIVCGGECYSSFYETGQQNLLFPKAAPFESYVHPGAGHGINFAANATGFYGEIVGFLDRNL
jgi:pimeloyl-ACP methyl ester carboxylesterase